MAAPSTPAPGLPEDRRSFWQAYQGDSAKELPSPQTLEPVDVLVLGGGIVGITSAYLLKQAGLRVGVVEASVVCGQKSVTGNSTAKLSAQARGEG